MLLALNTGWAQGLMNYESRATLDEKQNYYLQMAQREATSAKIDVATVDFDLLRSAGFTFNLPDGQAVEIIKKEEEDLDSKRQFFLGEVAGMEGDAHFIQKGEMLTGHIQINEKIYSIRPLGGNKHAVIEVDQGQFDACANSPSERTSNDRGVTPEEIERQLPQEWRNEGDTSDARSAGNCRVRVLVAYTNAVDAALADPLSTINLAIQLTNTGYANSGISHRLELARAYETNYTEHSDQYTNRNRFRINGDGYMDEVHNERARWRADMCHLLTNNGSGVAYINNSFSRTFAVTNYTYINGYTFGHEIGHNHLARHDPTADGTPGIYRGYGHPSGYFRTVMAYGTACGTNPCTRVNEYSGPNNYYYHPGTASWYVTGNATQNNVLAHNVSGGVIADHYTSYVNATYTSTTVHNDEAIHAAASLTIQNNVASPNFIYQNGSEGSFKASNRVTLNPGFRARSGSSFRAYLENCTPLRLAGEETVAETPEENYNHAGEETLFSATDYSLTAYPNPFQGQATIEYTVPENAKVNLYVRNTLGQVVNTLFTGEDKMAGVYKTSLNAGNLAQGVYYLVLETENERLVEKIVIAK